METISKIKLSDMVSEALVKFILEQGLQPGDKLPTEKAISEMLGIGRTSVREGIRELEAVGLLSSQQGNGIFLREVTIDSFFNIERRIPLNDFLTLTKDEIFDLLEARLIIETEACRLAAKRITDDELANMRDLCRKMENCLKERSEEFTRHDLEFHRQIIKASGNSILQKIVMLIRDIYSKQFKIFAYPKAAKMAFVSHKKILSALEDRNVELAEKYLTEHLKEVQALFHEKFGQS